ncbi:MAG: spermidine/putrescine ABC transporter substrate-binding protein [Acidimicrobiaceae bacterium]|nr:spermidine/putrescine ABC transporter substrate-binding protein [Acidimicrobiaceae bacterium]
MLAPESFRHAISRRALFQIGGAAAGLAIISACGGGDDDADSGSSDTGGSSGTSGGSSGGSDLLSQYSNVVNKASGNLAMFTWGEYNDPEIIGSLAESSVGVTMKVDYYPSNEDLITKLSAANGNSGFDIVVPTGAYIPQMIEKGLLQKFDKALLPNMVNVDPLYMARDWDPTNDYSVCKNWGSTGFFYNTTKITRPMATWQDFLDACMNEASGDCSVLDTAPNLCGAYFWANGINWTTEDPADLDACEAYMVDQFAQHIKAFDSYPSTAIAEGQFSLSMIWNGDGRAAYGRLLDGGLNVDEWKWVLPGPATEIWMDNYCIPTGAPNPEAAHAWINWLLTPEVSIKDLAFHGYHSGMKNIDQLIAELAPDLTYPEIIFFTDEQVATMQTGAVNSAQDRLVEIYDKVKAKAAG